MSGLLITTLTPEFRLSFPNLFTAALNTLSGKMEFKVVAMFDAAAQKTEAFKKLTEAIYKCAVDSWGADKSKWPKKLKYPLHDGNEKYEEDPKKYPMYKDIVYCNLKSFDKPPIRTPDNKAYILDAKEIYGGCYGIASINVKAFQHPVTKPISFGVALYLNGLIKTRDGEAFGGRVNVEEQFETVAVATSEEANTDDDLFGNLPPSGAVDHNAAKSKSNSFLGF